MGLDLAFNFRLIMLYTHAKPRSSGFVSAEFGVRVSFGVVDAATVCCSASGSVLKPSGYDIDELVASFV